MFTDFIGQPINEGDRIVYATSGYGGGADMHIAVIDKIVPLVPHRDYTGFMREDQANKAHATQFSGEKYNDPSKRFVIQIMRKKFVGYSRSGDPSTPYKEQRYTIPCSNSIVRVP